TARHAGLKPHLYNEQGRLRSFVNVYVNDEDIRYLQKESTPVSPGDTISIIPSVAGGTQTTEEVREDVRRVRLQADLRSQADLPPLTNDEFKRYSRHLIIQELRLHVQRTLQAAHELFIAPGGL